MRFPSSNTFRRVLSGAFFCGALLLAGCAGKQRVAEPPAPNAGPARPPATDRNDRVEAPARRTPGVSLQEIIDGALDVPPEADGPAVLERLAPPVRVVEEPVENRHVAGQVDTLRTLHYDGLQLTVYDISGSEKTLLTDVAVTDPAYQTGGLHVGSTRAAVEAALGAPGEREDDAYLYELGDVTPNLLQVHFRGDVVRELRWIFYYD